jgi:hypothetical protein
MQNHPLLLFGGAVLVLGSWPFLVARAKAVRVRASGTAMYAQPDQYAWFAALATAGPALLVSGVGAFLMLLLGAEIPLPWLLAGSLVVAAAGRPWGHAPGHPRLPRPPGHRAGDPLHPGRRGADLDLHHLRDPLVDHLRGAALLPDAQLLGVHHRHRLGPATASWPPRAAPTTPPGRPVRLGAAVRRHLHDHRHRHAGGDPGGAAVGHLHGRVRARAGAHPGQADPGGAGRHPHRGLRLLRRHHRGADHRQRGRQPGSQTRPSTTPWRRGWSWAS